jgi:hypothetical protein
VSIDTSVWIAYFRGEGDLDDVDWLIDENLVVTNDLILAELDPDLRAQFPDSDAVNKALRSLASRK